MPENCLIKGLNIKDYLEWDEEDQALILNTPTLAPPIHFGKDAVDYLLKFIEEHRKKDG